MTVASDLHDDGTPREVAVIAAVLRFDEDLNTITSITSELASAQARAAAEARYLLAMQEAPA